MATLAARRSTATASAALRHARRSASTSASAAYLDSPLWHTVLPDRAVLAVEGADSRKLLQGLTTANIDELVDGGAPLYTGFLSAPGRVLFDALLYPADGGGVLVDVDASVLPALTQHLKRYKLRSKVALRDASDELEVLAMCGGDAAALDSGAWPDPRLPLPGRRALRPRGGGGGGVAPPAGSAPAPADLYGLQAALLGVPNGAAELPTAEALPLESNLELLSGVSFAKGCYLGQELTARTHFRGVVRKRVLPVVVAAAVGGDGGEEVMEGAAALAHLPPPERAAAARLLRAGFGPLGVGGGEELSAPEAGAALHDGGGGKAVGKLRAFEPRWGVGLALCRISVLGGGTPLEPEGGGPQLFPLRPSWWPSDVA